MGRRPEKRGRAKRLLVEVEALMANNKSKGMFAVRVGNASAGQGKGRTIGDSDKTGTVIRMEN